MSRSAFIILFIFSSFAFAQIGVGKKTAWLQQLKACRKYCSDLAEQMLNESVKNDSSAKLSLQKQAHTTILYLHSYTMNPSELSEFHYSFLSDSNVNFYAPTFTAHHEKSTPLDFKTVNPEEWILDAELALHLVSALGKPVIIQGFSMGGMAAIGLAERYPEKIQKLVLIAPAVMITKSGDDAACAGQNGLIQSIIKSIVPKTIDRTYVEKYLNGGCSLAGMIKSIRNRYPITEKFKPNESGAKYFAAIDQVGTLASQVKVPTLLIYSEDDEAVDTRALEIFSKNLPQATVLTFKNSQQIVSHLTIYDNPLVPSTNTPLFREMRDFILKR